MKMKKTLFLIVLICTVLGYGCKKEEIYPATTSSAVDIQSFRLVTETGTSVISSVNISSSDATVRVTVPAGTALTHLFPSAVIPEGAIVKPALGVYADFTNPVQYTVIAGNREDSKEWTVIVSE